MWCLVLPGIATRPRLIAKVQPFPRDNAEFWRGPFQFIGDTALEVLIVGNDARTAGDDHGRLAVNMPGPETETGD